MSRYQAVTAIALIALLSAMTPELVASMRDPSEVQQSPVQKPGALLGTHAVKGTVTFVDASTLVIVCSRKSAVKMTFTLNPSTRSDGELQVGCAVSVRYVTDRGSLVATGVFVHEHSEATLSAKLNSVGPVLGR